MRSNQLLVYFEKFRLDLNKALLSRFTEDYANNNEF